MEGRGRTTSTRRKKRKRKRIDLAGKGGILDQKRKSWKERGNATMKEHVDVRRKKGPIGPTL